MGNAQVVRSFTLAGPDRLVVDLHNATLPRELPATTGRIRRVRLGTPAPGTQRVVLELGAGRAARDVVARVVKGALRVTFR